MTIPPGLSRRFCARAQRSLADATAWCVGSWHIRSVLQHSDDPDWWAYAARMASPGPAPVPLVPPRLDVAARENQVLRELVTIYHHLTGLALQSADLQTVAVLLAERMASLVGVVSPTLDVIAAAGPGQTPAEAAVDLQRLVSGRRLGRVLGTIAQTRRALRLPGADDSQSIMAAPILVGDDILAYQDG